MSTVRIASCFGAASDRIHGMARLAKNEDIHVIMGDWLSEVNMTRRAMDKVYPSGPTSVPYEPIFLSSLELALPDIARRKIKVISNAGASGTEQLAKRVQELVAAQNLNLNVAWVEGDEVDLDQILSNKELCSKLTNHATNEGTLASWPFKPFYAQCYLGAFGIVKALQNGADIVICGRVADASPCMASAIWYHNWDRTNYDPLAQALITGHLIECSNYVTGGNWSGFKVLGDNLKDMGYPIAEIDADGDVIITRETNSSTDGLITVDTCKSQLLYEIQGPLYFNSDVVANIENLRFDQVGKDRVQLSNVKGSPPPPTTKLGLTAIGGYQAEMHYYAVGLDVKEKARMLELQARRLLPQEKFSNLSVTITGTPKKNPKNQREATVDIKVFVQAREQETISPINFMQKIVGTIMQSYPGATFALDMRQAEPKPFHEYFVTLIDQSMVKQVVHLMKPGLKDVLITVPPPTQTQTYKSGQKSYETQNPVDLTNFGPTTKAPLGYIVHARSGDKASNCNVGFYVRHQDEWDWLRSLLTIPKIKELLADEHTPGKPIERFELPDIYAVHFLLVDLLDRGVSASSTNDALGKNVAEYLRSKHVDIPNKFLARGKI